MKIFQILFVLLALAAVVATGCDVSSARSHNSVASSSACACPVCSATSATPDKSDQRVGLLMMTHGSPSPQWNTEVEKLAEKVRKLNETKKTFHSIVAVNLEFNSPTPAEGVATLEKAGCGRIIVVPLFTMPGSHTIRDVPAVMGVYSSPSVKAKMISDAGHHAHDHAHSHDDSGCILHQAVRPKVPITITQTMDEGGLLEQYIRDEITALSQNPAEEAVLLLAHGDKGYDGWLEPLMWRLADDAVKNKKVAAAEWSYCRMGQDYLQNAVPTIERLTEKNKRVLVIGLYVISPASLIHQRALNQNKEAEISPFTDNIHFSETAIITNPATPKWVLQSAEEAL